MIQNLELISILKPVLQNTAMLYQRFHLHVKFIVKVRNMSHQVKFLVTLGSKTFNTLRPSFQRGCGTTLPRVSGPTTIHADESFPSSGTASRGRLCWPWAVSLQGARLLSGNLLGSPVGQGVKAT